MKILFSIIKMTTLLQIKLHSETYDQGLFSMDLKN